MTRPVALISVYDKNGIIEFAEGLVALGWDIVASGGTAKHLEAAGIAVTDVARLVGGGAILDHKVVTLSRELHASILASDSDEDRAELDRLGMPRIGLVCVNLYPLETETNREGATLGSVRAMTDIGGRALLMSAAKGERIVISHPDQREFVLDWLRGGRSEEDTTLVSLAAVAEQTVAQYSAISAAFLTELMAR